MLGNDTAKETVYNHTHKITASGMVSTFLVFGRHHNLTQAPDDKDEVLDDIDDFLSDLLDIDTEPDWIITDNRLITNDTNITDTSLNVTKSQFQDMNKTAIEIMGSVTFANSFGFLSAE